MANTVEIIIKATDQASKEFAKVEKSFETTKLSARGLAATMATVTAAAVVAKKGWDFTKAGAGLEQAQIKFDRLATSIGTTGDALRDDLGTATRGMLTDAEAMAAAGDLMALGLAKTHDEAVRMTKVASALGMNMNQLVLTLTNQTTMRFDALGVAVDGFDERLDGLKDTGMDVNEAFTEAFLQQAEEQIERVGEVADTTAGQMIILENRFKSMGESAKRQAAEAAGPVLDYAQANLALKDAIDAGVISYKEAQIMRREVLYTDMTMVDMTMELNRLMQEQAEKQSNLAESERATYESHKQMTELMQAESIPATYELTDATARYGDASERGAKKAKEVASAIRDQVAAAEEAAAAMQNYFDVFDNTEPADIASNLTDQFSGHLVDAANSAAAAGEDITPYLDALRELDPVAAAAMEQSFALTNATTALDEALLSGRISGDEYADAIEAMTLGIEAGVDPMIAMETQLDKLGIQLDANKDGVDDFRQSLETLVKGSPYTVEVQTVYTQSGSPSGGGGGASGGNPGDPPDLWTANAMNSPIYGTVPPGNQNDDYTVAMKTGEAFAVWNKSQGAPMGGDVNINFYGAKMGSGMDIEQTAMMVVERIREYL